ncbi:Rap-GAP domain-containing protein [Balamuthia mandrillaris]
MAAIRQARNAITKLTITLRDMVYPAPLILKIPGKPGAPDPTPTTSSGDMSSTSDDHIKDTGTARRDTTTLRPAQAWTLETITQTWHNVLRIFDKINTIVDSNLHKEALQVVTDTMDLLLDAEISALYEELTDTSRPKPLELVDIFGPWLFEACALPNKYLAGKANAYATLGRLVCRHHHNRLPLSFMVHYYRILLQGLSEPENTQCTSEIIVYSSDIFALGFEGSSILIPAYLDAIQYILFGNPKPAPSALVQRKALTIVCSLICLTPHLQGVEIPLFTKDEHDKQTKFSCEQAKEKVSTILCDTLSLPGSSQEMKIMCLWGLSVAIVEELAADHPSKASVEMWVERILSMTTFEDSAVVDSACDSLNTVSKTYDALMLLNPNLPLSVISTLICNVTNKMTGYAQTTSETERDLAEKLVTKHLQVLLDWIILAPTDLFNDASRARALFEAIELCLFGQKLSASSSSLASSSPTASGESNQLTITPSSSSESIQPPPSPPSSSSAFTSFWAMFSSLHTSPSHRSQAIRMGAETLLFTLNNHFNLFPPKEGPVIMHSVLKEHEDEEETDMSKCLYYIWNGWSIISLQPLPPTDLPPPPPLLTGSGKSSKDGSGGKKKKKGGKKSNRASSSPLSSRSGSLGGSNSTSNRGFGASPLRARIILRDPTGKYSWESCLAFDKLVPLVPVEACPSLFIPHASSSSSSSSSSGKSSGGGEAPRTPKKSSTYKRNKAVAPFYSAEVDESGIDKLEELLKYLGEKHTDCLPSYGNALNIPAPAEEQFQKDFRTYEQQLLVQAKEDRSGAFESLKKLGSYAIQPRAPTAPGWSPAFHSCRLLLSHLGFLAVEENENTFFQMPDITLVQANEKVRRSLSQLDKASVRELLKVGVIYVKEGQETQQVILRNDRESRSPLYTDFIESVAWTTRLKHHLGYLGGLDRILLSTGEDTPYYADHRLELILHDITSMPTDPEDRQQILKKRHVGNDIVHIVYSEHSRDYRPLTITSQFNDAHIVIYPLRNGLFRTQVFRKEKVALFGPVLDGMVLSKKVLGLLVRQTAINANQYVRNIMQGYEHPYPTRRRYVAEFAEKFSVGREDEANFLGEVWRRNEPKATISGGGAAGGGSLLQQSNSGISATGHITTVATPPGTPASSSASGSGSPVGAAMMAAAAVVGAAAASSSVASPLSSSASGTAVAQAAESKE